MSDTTATLESLCGEHFLSGVEMGTMPKEDEYDYEDPNVVDFILDGITYTAIENPDDGYRSSMDRLAVNRPGVNVKNLFAPVRVVGRMASGNEIERDEILEFVDAANGKTVLRVGTSNYEDWYPCFVGEWTPENLDVNKEQK